MKFKSMALAVLTALTLCGGELVLFPGKKPILPMVGFKDWQVADNILHATQSKGYAWTSGIGVNVNAADYQFFNIELKSSAAQKCKLTVYFRAPGARRFAPENYLRCEFNADGENFQTVKLPLKKNWQGKISVIRFDLSAKTGTQWQIKRIWMEGKSAPEVAVPAPVAAPAAPAEKSSDLQIFPGKKILPMTGFSSWNPTAVPLVAVQSKDYAYTDAVKVPLKAADYQYFNVELKSSAAQKCKLSLYFRFPGEKYFSAEKYLRCEFNADGENFQTVKLPLKKNWQGDIAAFRFDLSAKSGTKWEIKRIWFSRDAAAEKKTLNSEKSTPAAAKNDDEILLFPAGQKILPVVGFADFKTSGGVIYATQNKTYAYTSPIAVNADGSKCQYLNLEIKSSAAASGRLNIYYTHSGDKRFGAKKFIRNALVVSGKDFDIVSLPMGKKLRGKIANIRIDFSGFAGMKWEIKRIWFSTAKPILIENKALRGKVKLADNESISTGKSVDFINLFKYRFSADVTDTDGSWQLDVVTYNELGEKIAVIPGKPVAVTGSKKLALDMVFPPFATEYEVVITRHGKGRGTIANAAIREIGSAEKPWDASWLCHPEYHSSSKEARFVYRKKFTLDAVPYDARFKGTADDGLALFVNGKEVFRRAGGWQKVAVCELNGLLKAGENTVEVEVLNYSGATGFLGNITCFFTDGSRQEINSDGSWQVIRIGAADTHPFDYAQAVMAHELGVPPIKPWNFVQLVQFAPRQNITIADGKLQQQGKKISGTVKLNGMVDGTLPLALQSGNFTVAEFSVPVKNGVAAVEIDLAGSAISPGEYLLLPDPAKLTYSGKLLTVNVPREKVEPNIRCEMKNINGVLYFVIDGKPTLLTGFKLAGSPPNRMLECYRGANLRTAMISISLGTNHGTTSGRTWKGKGIYDFTPVDRSIENILKFCPDARIIISYGIDAPSWWMKQHPEECVWYENGTVHAGLSSPASRKWRDESKAAFIKFLQYCESSPYASRIIGYRITAHCDGGEFQYLGGWQRQFADYSPAMQKYFREYLTKKYGSDAALQKAWHRKNVTLATAQIPSGKEKKASEFFMFRDMAKAQNVADYVDCHSFAMVDAAMEFLRLIRQYAPNKLAGLYGGYLYYYGGFQLLYNGHSQFFKLYQSRLADFICTPNDYVQRKVGWPAGHHTPFSGTALYNLANLDENDTRTIMCTPGGHRHVDNLHETIGVFKRDGILQLTKGLGNVNYDLGGGWLSHPGIINAIRTMNKISKFADGLPGFTRSKVAVLYSAGSISRLALENNAVSVPVRENMRHELGISGISADQYLLEDILQDNFPEYDCYILPNVYAPSDELRQAIDKKLKKPGKLLVFGFAPGAFKDGQSQISPEAMKELTGMDIAFEMRKERRSVKYDGGVYGSGAMVGPAFAVTDPAAEVWGKYTASGNTALAYKENPGSWNSLVALAPEMPAELWRKVFKRNGIHLFTTSNDPAYYDGRFVAIHAASDGRKRLSLPEKRNWYDLARNKKIASDTAAIELDMKRGATEIFFIGSEAEFKRFQEMGK
ncbi:MAG: beta-galactosidase [Lentisphaeria bacterium]|nr:beta-galactosidase [Lentisphaeria bacterium]